MEFFPFRITAAADVQLLGRSHDRLMNMDVTNEPNQVSIL